MVESRRAALGPPTAPTLRDTVALKGARGVIAQRMHQSLQTTAQLTFHRDVYTQALARFRTKLRSTTHETVTYNDIILLALARVLPEYPALNATLDGEIIYRWASVNLGVAVALEEGLVVAVIRECQMADLARLIEERRRLADQARAGTIRSRDLLGSTFTVTNLGAFGVDGFTPIINPPEVAILGVGRIRKDETMTLSLTVDHQAVDGVPAARFLAGLAEVLEQPDALRLEAGSL